MSISLKIKELRKQKKLTQDEFSSMIGVDNSQLSKIERGVLRPTLEHILEISSKFNVTTDYLLKDDVLEVNILNEPETLYGRMPSIITIPEKEQEKENIEIVPVKLAAGYVGGGFQKEDFIKNLPKFRLPYLNNGSFRCFGVGGYSMHNGIQDEDWFVGKFVDNLFNLSEGKIHAVIAPKAESLLIKRVFRHPTKSDFLILRSDNNDTYNTFPDIEIHISNISELWSYAGLISFKEPAYDFSKFREILSLNLHKVSVE
ncbi:helix-turn-helix transcriptional regulator [Empedobacter sp.]|uniref:XRE family transcriptional regulator n=1 Tax=Empedobacter sp. TaxID=1927715 RepID=UPI002896C8C3|nr:helix-turn-helix transcriptional regulator [Empedobacter sp.]